MKHSIDELIHIVYHYYPRGISELDLSRAAAETEETRRLVEARRQAGADCSRWRDMLQRVGDEFPERGVSNLSVHLATGGSDACYSGSLSLPDHTAEHWHHIDFMVSFLVPYYIVFSSRIFDDLEEIERMKARRAAPSDTVALFVGDTMFVLPTDTVKPEFREPPPLRFRPRRREVSFDFSTDEQPYASWITQDIEATWEGYECMPPEIGKVIVPDVSTNARKLGDATLYDCLFTDNW